MGGKLRKLKGSLKIAATLVLARTFGAYEHSGFDGKIEYARYTWRGRSWVIPTSPVSREEF